MKVAKLFGGRDSSTDAKEKNVVLQGKVQHFSVVEVVQLLQLSKNSGILWIGNNQNNTKPSELYFQNGFLIRGVGPKMTNFGSLLLQLGYINNDVLNRGLRIQEASEGEETIGGILIRLGAIDREMVKNTIIRQIEEVFENILDQKSGEFAFHLKDHRSPDGILVNLKELALPGEVELMSVLMRASQHHDERKK